MNRQYYQVEEFHEACGIEMPDRPKLLSGAGDRSNIHWGSMLDHHSKVMKKFYRTGGDVKKRLSYMVEELAEFAMSETLEEQTDALTDLLYFTLGTFTLMGVRPEEIFNIVHAANMQKVDPETGRVRRNEQGKILKPEGWEAPEPLIKAEITRQGEMPLCSR